MWHLFEIVNQIPSRLEWRKSLSSLLWTDYFSTTLPNQIRSMSQHMAAEQQACAKHTKQWKYPVLLIIGRIVPDNTCLMQPRLQQKDLLSSWEHEWGKYSTRWHQLASVPRVWLVEMMRQWSTQFSANLFHTCYREQISNADMVLLSSQWDTGVYTCTSLCGVSIYISNGSWKECFKMQEEKRFTLTYRAVQTAGPH